jgi:hypothetical protein
MHHGSTPVVQHGGDADAGAEVLGVRRDGAHRLARRSSLPTQLANSLGPYRGFWVTKDEA